MLYTLYFIAIGPLVLEKIVEGILSPRPMEASYEILASIGPVVLDEKKMVKTIDGWTDDGRTTDVPTNGRTTHALLYDKLTYEPKGSGEQKRVI